MPNRLQYESSPYLLQHANNPVEWYPWGDEAFDLAKREDKPVLVSIGYAACHWCHVMEHESFEDAAVAAFMNENFVNIKVDREEHPDVDHLYMDALQAMTGAGGWPLNMFVTPDRKPFYGGTYFPPRSMYGRSSWMEVIGALHRAWHEKPEEITLQATQMLDHLKQASLVAAAGKEDKTIRPEEIKIIAQNLLQQADTEAGGFGAAPKFPATGAIRFLMEYYHFYKETDKVLAEEALQQSLLSLDKMIQGGIYDQVGGGFSRYATDKDWLVPHFEKMLYDNALLTEVLCDAYQITGKEIYKDVIRETIDFCNRELRSDEAPGYYCALDADSEGAEGKFYTWTFEEWQEVMQDAHPALALYFGVSEEGNWEHTNILNEAVPAESFLAEYNLTTKGWNDILKEAKTVLFEKRKERIRPATDDKVLLSWNALMNIALVKASIALQDKNYLVGATEHMHWLLSSFDNGDEGLLHVYKSGKARIMAKLDDYAYVIAALLQLASATGNEEWVRHAERWTGYVCAHFMNEDQRFFYFSSRLQNDIVVRKIELYDGATPAANSMMLENLYLLGNLLERSDWLEQSMEMMYAMKQTAIRYPTSFARWAIQIQRQAAGLKQLIITGDKSAQVLAEWQKEIHPEIFAMVGDDKANLPALQYKYNNGQTLLYLCENFSCRKPVSTLSELNDYL